MVVVLEVIVVLEAGELESTEPERAGPGARPATGIGVGTAGRVVDVGAAGSSSVTALDRIDRGRFEQRLVGHEKPTRRRRCHEHRHEGHDARRDRGPTGATGAPRPKADRVFDETVRQGRQAQGDRYGDGERRRTRQRPAARRQQDEHRPVEQVGAVAHQPEQDERAPGQHAAERPGCLQPDDQTGRCQREDAEPTIERGAAVGRQDDRRRHDDRQAAGRERRPHDRRRRTS